MILHKQTSLHNPPQSLGNCYATVIASILDLSSPNDCIQIQEYYKNSDWSNILNKWLLDKGYEIKVLDSHLYDDSYYFVSGKTERGFYHICIYKNGKLFHDPHPSNSGLITEEDFEILQPKYKKCFKCVNVKLITDFYKHSGMSDGRLNKCKVCNIQDSKKQTDIKTSTPEGLEKERERHRNKYKRLGYREKQLEWDREKPWKNNPIYKSLRKRYKHLGRDMELHHWSYKNEHLKDIFILNIREHKRIHNFLVLDLKERCFKTTEGILLDTKEKHKEYIEKIIKNEFK